MAEETEPKPFDGKRRAVYVDWTRDVIRYADLDPNGHVNNGAINQFFEDGRVHFRNARMGTLGASILTGFAIRRFAAEYNAVLNYPGEVEIGLPMWVGQQVVLPPRHVDRLLGRRAPRGARSHLRLEDEVSHPQSNHDAQQPANFLHAASFAVQRVVPAVAANYVRRAFFGDHRSPLVSSTTDVRNFCWEAWGVSGRPLAWGRGMKGG